MIRPASQTAQLEAPSAARPRATETPAQAGREARGGVSTVTPPSQALPQSSQSIVNPGKTSLWNCPISTRKATWYEGGHNGRSEKPIISPKRQLWRTKGTNRKEVEVKTEEAVCGKGGTKGGTKEEGIHLGKTRAQEPLRGRDSKHKMGQPKCQTYKRLVIDKGNRKWILLARLLAW